MDHNGSSKQSMLYSYFSVNDHYPGRDRSIDALYREVLAQGELADELGYDTFFVAEHHFHEYGVVPNPAIMLAALSQRTNNIRLGTAISVLTFHNPITIAENYSIVDVLSGGRLVMGVGSGYLKHEYEGFGIDPATKRERFDENFALVQRAMAGERITFDGTYNHLKDVALNTLPTQRPTPPFYVAVLQHQAAYYVGRQGHNMMCVPYASVDKLEDVALIIEEYHRGLAETSTEATGDAIVTLHTHVADTDEQARQVATEPFDLYVATRLYAKSQTYEDVMASRLGLFGSVDTVVERLLELYDMGVRHVSTLHNFGLMPYDQANRSMRMLADEVMPRVHKALGIDPIR
ncbi:LLM class flavin-dependent oxidoreductase [Rhodococcus sp. JS3073]|uniref:LLM class flavin-dependent oxidoreductase n=1 Tax=Rhodococcus sp. JS3073 TaxID=3002901 RepID=UPI0022854F1A|nr:LLM class flavin-dependent oxidoreductase [Rhodococcus sp. JS3073]WAM19263.1 LLM class flavin-dependent oxidoreductase [Rhodococcus sp. JS3073]